MIFINLILLNLLFLCDFVYAVELTELEVLPDSDQQCETVQSEIHLFKEEFNELGRIKRTCNGEVLLNKCEGFCNSFVKPSSITVTGFLKECFCCRETFLQDRTIVLTHCYNPDGRRITKSKLTEMEVRLKEPAECRCYKCGNFSR